MTHKQPPKCACGHSWERHHHGCIMRIEYPVDAHAWGVCGGVMAQECEWTQVNGDRIREEEPECFCDGYVNSKTGQPKRSLPLITESSGIRGLRYWLPSESEG